MKPREHKILLAIFNIKVEKKALMDIKKKSNKHLVFLKVNERCSRKKYFLIYKV